MKFITTGRYSKCL